MPYFVRNEDGEAEDVPVTEPSAKLEVSPATATDSQQEIFGIPVIVEKAGDQFVVMDDEIAMYGVGDTIEAAKEDYRNIVKEYFQMLNSRQGKLGPHLESHWRYLCTKQLVPGVVDGYTVP